MIYLIIFIVSCLLIIISGLFKNNKFFSKLLLMVGILLPCLLAGLRHYTVGTDVKGYVYPMYQFAVSSTNFKNYLSNHWTISWQIKSVSKYEIGFSALIYIIGKITNNFQVLLFFIQLLMVIPIYFGIKKINDNPKFISFGILVYYFMLYHVSLNIVRQFLSIGFIFYGSCCLLKDNNYKKFIMMLLIGSLFHSSAIMGIVLLIIYFLLNNRKELKKVVVIANHKIPIQKVISFIIIIISTILVFNPNLLIKALQLIGLKKYISYINGDVTFSLKTFIFRLPILLLLLANFKRFLDSDKNSYFYVAVFCLDIIVSQFVSVSAYAQRISYIFQTFNLILVPKLCELYNKKNIKKIIVVLVIAYLCYYWNYQFIKYNRGETYPYIYFNK